MLAESLPESGATDVDLVYQINSLPSQVLYLLTFEMAALEVDGTPSSVMRSDPIYVTLAPAGETPEERLQQASLFLEAYVVNLPEPSAAMHCLALLGWLFACRARRSPFQVSPGCQ